MRNRETGNHNQQNVLQKPSLVAFWACLWQYPGPESYPVRLSAAIIAQVDALGLELDTSST